MMDSKMKKGLLVAGGIALLAGVGVLVRDCSAQSSSVLPSAVPLARTQQANPAALLPSQRVNAPVAATPTAAVAAVAPAAVAPAAVSGATVVSSNAASPTTPVDPLALTSDDHVQGSMMAPITIIEYGSLTCGHCGDFYTKTLPMVKKEWVDTGKAKFVYRDMPWDDFAFGMAKIAHCAPREQFEPLVGAFYAGQNKILSSSKPLDEVKNITRLAGMSDEQVDACLKDADLHAKVSAIKDIAYDKLGVRGTPAFFINGTKVEGALPYKKFKEVLEEELAKKSR